MLFCSFELRLFFYDKMQKSSIFYLIQIQYTFISVRVWWKFVFSKVVIHSTNPYRVIRYAKSVVLRVHRSDCIQMIVSFFVCDLLALIRASACASVCVCVCVFWFLLFFNFGTATGNKTTRKKISFTLVTVLSVSMHKSVCRMKWQCRVCSTWLIF